MKRLLVAIIILVSSDMSLAQSWHYVAPMNFARTEHCAISFPDGRVLVAGGNDGNEVLSSCEIYDPKTDTWTLTGSMNEQRYRFPMITLSDGRIMAAGGLTDMDVATSDGVEIYDPNTGVWTQMAPMSNRRENFPLHLLPNGKVFICGGLDANVPQYLSSAEVFDPLSNTYQEVAPFPTQVFAPFLFYDSADNKMLLQGGSYGGLNGIWPPIVQVYDFVSNSWSFGPQTITPHDGTNVQMPDQSIVLLGGRTGPYTCTDSIEILSPPFNGPWQFIGRLTSKRWHGVTVVVGTDSILDIGGNNDPGYGTDAWDSTNWFFVKEGQTQQGPLMLTPRAIFAAVLSAQPAGPCKDSDVIYAFGGTSTGQVVNTCEALPLGVKYLPGSGPSTFAIPATTQSILASSCKSEDTSIQIGVVGCDATNALLDSAWIAGSSAIKISDSRTSPRPLGMSDSITIEYSPGANMSDTAQLNIRFDLGSGARDTSITIVGSISSPLLSAPVSLHREVAVSNFGSPDSLPLGVDISSSVNLDSIWPYLHDISATYSFDSTVVSYYAYIPPSGWISNTISNRGNAVDFTIHKVSSPSPSQPMDLGAAEFLPSYPLLETSDVSLTRFVMDIGNQSISPCVSEDEDQHWSVKVLVTDGVNAAQSQTNSLSIYPNPAGDELFVDNPDAENISITFYDAIGRAVLSANASGGMTTGIDVSSLPPSAYMVVCHERGGTVVRRIIKN
jgi:hypothetical protein